MSEMNREVEQKAAHHAEKETPAGEKVARAAAENLGKELWQAPDVSKERGAAVAVSKVLEQAGELNHIDRSVLNLVDDLSHKDWHRHNLNEAKPGDVVVSNKLGFPSNVGIVDEKGNVMTNDSHTGKWTERSIHSNHWTYALHKGEK